MSKKVLLNFVKEIVLYVIVVLILLLIADKSGWTNTAVLDNLIGLTAGYIFVKLVMLLNHVVTKKRNKSDKDDENDT